MKTIGNILWLVFGGLLMSIGYFLLGLLLCVTIIGIPFGLQLFKMGRLVLLPFGTDVKTEFDEHPIANIIWLIFFGWELAISHVIIGLLCCITIIGIPFGKQWFKLAKLALLPFGADLK
jgi:uncharacterized membrane protein YccF (DUF307 family)